MRLNGQIANIRSLTRLVVFAFAVLSSLPADAGLTFTPGHIYSSSNGVGSIDIYEYRETGTFLASLTPQSLVQGDDELRGIAFGPDGLLYAVAAHCTESNFSILALHSSGNVQTTYPMDTIGLCGDSNYGKIAFDQQYIYVAAAIDLVRFTFGDPNSAVSIYSNNGVVDVKTLPNGHLFVAWAYGVDEITNTGTIVRSIPLIGADWGNVEGIEYEPATDTLFAFEFGYSGFEFQLMRINASTGMLENSVPFTYGSDLFLTRSNTLLVGSFVEPPGIFDENLNSVGTLGTDERVFVTQCNVAGPTPTPTPPQRPSPTPRPRPTPHPRPGGGF